MSITIHLPLFFLFFLFLLSSSNATFSRSISKEEMGIKSHKNLTHLHFYFHDYVAGPRRTAVWIAKPNTTDKDPNSFGALAMIDDPLSVGPDNSSHVIGYAQGMYGFADQTTAGLLMVMTFVFRDGEYRGSSLSVLGRNEVFLKVREMAVVGGTGVFRFASGYCQAKTISGLDKSGASVIEYDVYVSH